jgi:hypothetical protein
MKCRLWDRRRCFPPTKKTPDDFFGQFCARMSTDALWEARRYQLVITNTIKAELAHYPDIADPDARVAHAVTDRLDMLERLYRIMGWREHRFDAVIRLAERHRSNLGTLLSLTTEQVEDAEFREVDDETADGHQLQPRHEDEP